MTWRDALDFVYLTRARAAALGFTHEGTLYGVPAWMREIGGNPETDPIIACPKVPLLQMWTLLADATYEVATWFMPADCVLEMPITVKGPIPAEASV